MKQVLQDFLALGAHSRNTRIGDHRFPNDGLAEHRKNAGLIRHNELPRIILTALPWQIPDRNGGYELVQNVAQGLLPVGALVAGLRRPS